MSLKEKIEKNITLAVLGLLFVGFGAGFGAYKTIFEITGQTTISKDLKVQLESRSKKLEKIKAELIALKDKFVKDAKLPSDVRITITSAINDTEPVDNIEMAEFDSQIIIHTKWFGLTPKALYEQVWKISDPNKDLVDEYKEWVVPNHSVVSTWYGLTLDSAVYPPGEYMYEILLNESERSGSLHVQGK